jgi:hypothetical protein
LLDFPVGVLEKYLVRVTEIVSVNPHVFLAPAVTVSQPRASLALAGQLTIEYEFLEFLTVSQFFNRVFMYVAE